MQWENMQAFVYFHINYTLIYVCVLQFECEKQEKRAKWNGKEKGRKLTQQLSLHILKCTTKVNERENDRSRQHKSNIFS